MIEPFDAKNAFSLAGKRALVTGGASGIGQAIAVAFAQAGADVAFTTHSHPGDETAAAIKAAGRTASEVPVDLGRIDAAGAEALMGDLEARFGPVDILVNNAGIIRRADLPVHGEADWRAVMATNLDAVWFLSQAAGRRMGERGDGRLIAIASVLSFQGGIRVPGYAAAKHAVAGLTKALANELASRNVCANAIAPGYIATDNTAALRADAERSRQILERIPAGRWGRPNDIAGAAVFLASPAAAYVNGAILSVDGGWMAR
ncbi:SDR family oxidoreductase [Nitratireductor sp. ZSWI3]|uniref:SDR family oxidoreductase n=1 Tax=Nitratireductor sp. ZSWI3 TaxID=2966359 RepID=UPI00214F7BBA|nr:SDR family oxidoreductase [Nitratireductor sp. ZSWI3]MCR4268086.1 SDR family oxidoreductase [Nitratireductor sp. ZSWI3]